MDFETAQERAVLSGTDAFAVARLTHVCSPSGIPPAPRGGSCSRVLACVGLGRGECAAPRCYTAESEVRFDDNAVATLTSRKSDNITMEIG
jgi:hypothetical protein